MADRYSTQRNGLALASYTPITYTPKLMDMNTYNSVLSSMEEKHYKALQGQAEIAKQFRELNLNPKEDEYINNLSAQYQKKINDAIDSGTGYAGNAVEAVFEVGKDIQQNNVLWGKVKNSKLYDDAKAKVTKMYEDGKIDDKAYNRWLEQNPYTSIIKKEGETDEAAAKNREIEARYNEAVSLLDRGIIRSETANRPDSLDKKEIGVTTWTPNYSPVEKVSMADIFKEAINYVSPEKGKYEKVYFLDAKGNFTENFDESVDGYWYYKNGTTYDKLSESKIAEAINAAIAGNSKFRQSLEQEYADEAWDYDKNKSTYTNNSGLINNKGVKKNLTNYISDKIAKIANLKAYNYYYAEKDYNNEASKNLALRRAASGSGVDINPNVDSFIGSTGISMLHDANETVDQALSKRDNIGTRLTNYFRASGLNDEDINKLINNDYVTINDKQYDAVDYIRKMYVDGQIDYRTADNMLTDNVYKRKYDEWYDNLIQNATPEQKNAIDFFEALAKGDILNSDNEISKMFDQFDIDENSYITVNGYQDITGAKQKYNMNELSDLITLIGNSDGDISLTLHDNQGDTNLATGVYKELGSAYLPEVSYTTRIKNIYNDYKNKKDDILKNKINDKLVSTMLLGSESFVGKGIDKKYQEGIIDTQTRNALNKESEDNIRSHLASVGWANVNAYYCEDGDTQGNYLRKLVNSKDRVEKGKMVKEALINGKIHMQPTVNKITGRPAIYLSVSPYTIDKDTKPGFTMLIDDLEISEEAEKYINDTDTQALIEYTENSCIDSNYAVAGTGISAIDGDSFNCPEGTPDRDKLKVISGCKILEKVYNAASLGAINLDDETSAKRVNAAITEALDNISGYYGFDGTDRLTASAEIRNKIIKLINNERR